MVGKNIIRKYNVLKKKLLFSIFFLIDRRFLLNLSL